MDLLFFIFWIILNIFFLTFPFYFPFLCFSHNLLIKNIFYSTNWLAILTISSVVVVSLASFSTMAASVIRVNKPARLDTLTTRACGLNNLKNSLHMFNVPTKLTRRVVSAFILAIFYSILV